MKFCPKKLQSGCCILPWCNGFTAVLGELTNIEYNLDVEILEYSEHICDFYCNEFTDIRDYMKDTICCFCVGSKMIIESNIVIQVCTMESYTARFCIFDCLMYTNISGDLSKRDFVPKQ